LKLRAALNFPQRLARRLAMRQCSIRRFVVVGAVLAVAILACESVQAQGVPVTNHTRKALNFYGGQRAISTLNEMPRRTPIQPTSYGPLPHNGKPFQTASTGPTISPYLNLFRDENENGESVPTYFSFVRPQMEQQAAAQQQQRDIAQLQRQVQGRAQARAISTPGAGVPARYMDTAQFYGGWQR
jgi:hypothetical protein